MVGESRGRPRYSRAAAKHSIKAVEAVLSSTSSRCTSARRDWALTAPAPRNHTAHAASRGCARRARLRTPRVNFRWMAAGGRATQGKAGKVGVLRSSQRHAAARTRARPKPRPRGIKKGGWTAGACRHSGAPPPAGRGHATWGAAQAYNLQCGPRGPAARRHGAARLVVVGFVVFSLFTPGQARRASSGCPWAWGAPRGGGC